MNVSPTQDDVQTALAAFLGAVFSGVTGKDSNPVEVIAAVDNRVPEPVNASFVVMTVIRSPRLATNIDSFLDCKFTGSISGTTLTVSAIDPVVGGTIKVGATVFGVGVVSGTVVQAQLTGAPGGVGTYRVAPGQTVGSETLSAGQKQLLQKGEFVVQLDFHTADNTASDLAKTVSTALRDEFGTSFFDGLAPPGNAVRPLYADDPRYLPFVNEAQQYEWRWVLEAHLQVDQVVSVPQQFFDPPITLTTISVDAAYPPH